MKKFLSEKVLGKIAYKVSINAPFEEIYEKLEKAIENNGFTVIHVHSLRDMFQRNNLSIEDDFEYKIVELCNSEKAYKILNMGFDMGVMMPKSIIVARKNGLVELRYMQMKPWMVGMMFPDVDIVPMSKKVMKIMKKIVHEAIDNS